MNGMFNYIGAHSRWLLPFLPLFCVMVYFTLQSRWNAYTRKKAYEELKLLNDLRERNIITAEEFEERKDELLRM